MSYQGSYALQYVADAAGLPIDQFNFAFSQVVAIVFGIAFRAYLKPSRENTYKRHLVNSLVGVLLGTFFYGTQLWHLLFQCGIVYLALIFCPRKYVHLFTIAFTMGHLSTLHIYRLIYDYGNYTLDITGGIMISTQKLTSLAFAYYDGMRSEDKLKGDQKDYAIKERPSVLEFVSYTFNFQGIIVGPLCFYKDYVEFINGNNIRKYKKNDEDGKTVEQPSILFVMVKKLTILAFLGILFIKLPVAYPFEYNMTEECTSSSLWFRAVYLYISAGAQRLKYYLAWVIADAVNNASGLGFNGYDANGNPKWDLVTNINIINIELSTSLKTSFDNWNIQTQKWLRIVAYDRLPTGKTLGVFVLSAFWHGFYPGYYLTFVLFAFIVYAGRGIRRKIRPYFQANQLLIIIYALITWYGTSFTATYAYASFNYLEFWRSIEFYNQWYWCLHIIVVVITLTLPGGSSKPKKNANTDEKKPLANNENKID